MFHPNSEVHLLILLMLADVVCFPLYTTCSTWKNSKSTITISKRLLIRCRRRKASLHNPESKWDAWVGVWSIKKQRTPTHSSLGCMMGSGVLQPTDGPEWQRHVSVLPTLFPAEEHDFRRALMSGTSAVDLAVEPDFVPHTRRSVWLRTEFNSPAGLQNFNSEKWSLCSLERTPEHEPLCEISPTDLVRRPRWLTHSTTLYFHLHISAQARHNFLFPFQRGLRKPS